MNGRGRRSGVIPIAIIASGSIYCRRETGRKVHGGWIVKNQFVGRGLNSRDHPGERRSYCTSGVDDLSMRAANLVLHPGRCGHTSWLIAASGWGPAVTTGSSPCPVVEHCDLLIPVGEARLHGATSLAEGDPRSVQASSAPPTTRRLGEELRALQALKGHVIRAPLATRVGSLRFTPSGSACFFVHDPVWRDGADRPGASPGTARPRPAVSGRARPACRRRPRARHLEDPVDVLRGGTAPSKGLTRSLFTRRAGDRCSPAVSRGRRAHFAPDAARRHLRRPAA